MDTVPQLIFGCLFLPVVLLVASTDTTAEQYHSVEILGAPDLYVALGGQLNLTCVVAQPRREHPDPEWLHNGVTVVSTTPATHFETDSHIDGSRRSSLIRKMAVRTDEGEYTCVVDSVRQASIMVHVMEEDEGDLEDEEDEEEEEEEEDEEGEEREEDEGEESSGGGGTRRGLHHATMLPHHPPGGCINAVTGAILANGDEWREDPCTTCHCENGRKKCQAYMCHTSCINPKHVAGECCPVCDSTSVVTLPPHCSPLTHCSLRCPQGFVKGKDGCFRCMCQAEECQLECPHGLMRDGYGNKLCECAPMLPVHCPSLSSCRKNCTYGLHINRHGCPVCKCYKCKRMVFSSAVHVDPSPDGSTGSLIKSTSHGVLLLCPGPCLHGYMKDERGCSTCWCNEPSHSSEGITPVYAEEVTKAALPCISADGSKKSPDEVWWNGCRKCQCIEGVESCSKASCPSVPPTCDHPIIINGHCCPVCSEPVSLIVLCVLCGFVLVVLIFIAVRVRHYVWWPRRGCLRFADEDGGVRVLGASPSPTDSPGPQGNGIIKYDIPQMPLGGVGGTGGGGIKAMRRSGEYYESVPRYEQTLGDCEKSALAPL